MKSYKPLSRIHAEDILYIKAHGDYVVYHLRNGKRRIYYSSLEKVQEQLPSYFKRIDEFYLINSQAIISFNEESVEVKPTLFLSIGNSYKEITKEL